jgi:tRNA dimethylallyltransferase
MARDALVITGATATGKTDLAVAVALRVRGEVVSMDSRQVYRGMDIGTAKPTAAELCGVPHFGFDLLDPSERFSAGQFARLARGWIEAIRARGHVPILAGGTGFFLRSLTDPLFAEPPLDEALKESWKRYLAARSTGELARWAAFLDPVGAGRTGDRQRLCRLIEVAILTGRPLSWWQRQAPADTPAIDPLAFVLELPRSDLVRRIDERVDAMIGAGLVDEVRALLDQGFDERDPGMNATGYIEMIPHVRGERSIDEAAELVRVATRRYARRQATWFRNQLPANTIRLDAGRDVEELADTVTRRWEKESA